MSYISDNFCASLLKEFINTDTRQPEGNEERMVKAVLSHFPENIEKKVIDHGNGRETLIIKIKGESETGGVAFVGHTDTVATGDVSKWSFDPLAACEKDGYIYGRGAADMKSGDCAMIAAALETLSLDKTPKEPIYLCFTADEEVGGLGALAVAKDEWMQTVKAFFVAEPTNEDIGVCEKGALWLRIKTTGRLSHGSRPEVGINAVEKTMEFYSRFLPLVNRTSCDKYLGSTTVSVTKLQGGIMTNVIPAYCEMELDMRTLTDIDHDKVIEGAKKLAETMADEKEGLSIEIEVINNRPAVATPEDHPFVGAVAEICRENGLKDGKKGLFFYTDASQVIPAVKAPFVIFGPGDDLMAHQTDERVEISSMTRMAKVYFDYIKKYCF